MPDPVGSSGQGFITVCVGGGGCIIWAHYLAISASMTSAIFVNKPLDTMPLEHCTTGTLFAENL